MIKLTKADVGKKFVCKNGERLTLVSVSSGKRPFCMSDGTHYDSNGRFEAHEFDSQYNIISRVTCGRPKGSGKKPYKQVVSTVSLMREKLAEHEANLDAGTYTPDAPFIDDSMDKAGAWLIRNGHVDAGVDLLTKYRA